MYVLKCSFFHRNWTFRSEVKAGQSKKNDPFIVKKMAFLIILHVIVFQTAIFNKIYIKLEFRGSRLTRSLYSQNIQRWPPLGA